VSKKAENAVSYLDRTNIHSTKPYKTGDNSHLATRHYDAEYSPGNVVDIEKKREELDNLKRQLVAKVTAIEDLIRPINDKLSKTLPFDEYIKLKALKRQYALDKTLIQKKLTEVNKQKSGLSRYPTSNFSEMFHSLAKQILPRDVYTNLVEAVKKHFQSEDLINHD